MRGNILLRCVILLINIFFCYAQFPMWNRRPMFRRPPFLSPRDVLRMRGRVPFQDRRLPFSFQQNLPVNRNRNVNRFRFQQNSAANSQDLGQISVTPRSSALGRTAPNQFNFQSRIANTRNMDFRSQLRAPNSFSNTQNSRGVGTPRFQARQQGITRGRNNIVTPGPQQFSGQQQQQQQQRQQQLLLQQQRLQQRQLQQRRLQQQQLRQQQQQGFQQRRQGRQQISMFPSNPFQTQGRANNFQNTAFPQGQLQSRRRGQQQFINQIRRNAFPGNPQRTQLPTRRQQFNSRNALNPIESQVINRNTGSVTQTGQQTAEAIPVRRIATPSNAQLDKVFSQEQALKALTGHNNAAGEGAPEGAVLLPENFDTSKVDPKQMTTMVTITDAQGNILYRAYDVPDPEIDKIANEIAENLTKSLNEQSPQPQLTTSDVNDAGSGVQLTQQQAVADVGSSGTSNALGRQGIITDSQPFVGQDTSGGSSNVDSIFADQGNTGSSTRTQGSGVRDSPFFERPSVPAEPPVSPRRPLQFLNSNQQNTESSGSNSPLDFQEFLSNPSLFAQNTNP